MFETTESENKTSSGKIGFTDEKFEALCTIHL